MNSKKRKNKKSLVLLLALTAMIEVQFLSGITLSSSNTEALEVWKKINRIQENNLAMIESLEVQYDFSLKIDIKQKPCDLSKKCSYGRKYTKFYMYEESKDNLSDVNMSYETRFDGTLNRTRFSQFKKTMTIDHSPQRLSTPTPYDLIVNLKPETLNNALKTGQAEVISAENAKENGVTCDKITFRLVNGTLEHKLEIWYDLEHGYWPILTKEYDKFENGNLIEEINNVAFQKVVIAENEYFFPISGRRAAFENSKTVYLQEFKVKSDSLKINEDIPDSQFTLEPIADEVIWDRDLGITLRDPGKEIDLTDLSGMSVESRKFVEDKNEAQSRENPKESGPEKTHGNIEKNVRLQEKSPNNKCMILLILAFIVFVIALVFWTKSKNKKLRFKGNSTTIYDNRR